MRDARNEEAGALRNAVHWIMQCSAEGMRAIAEDVLISST
jgi:hypothetical protein